MTKNDCNKNKKVEVNIKKPYIHQILVVPFSSICLVSIKRAGGRAVFSKFFSILYIYISIDLKLVEIKKNRGQSFYYIIKPELRFCAGSNPARTVLEIHDGEDLWLWSQLETRLNTFRQSTIPQKQFIIIHHQLV